MNHKAGYVNIFGKPNVGKSTLLNALVGERLAIITSKAQTTRHRILGILNEPEYQIIFSDTPGLISPNYKLQEAMMQFVKTALDDADIFIFVVDNEKPSGKNLEFAKMIADKNLPLLLLLNKIDLSDQQKINELITLWNAEIPKAEIIPISAKEKFNTDFVLSRITELIPESPPYFDKEDITDKPERFFVSETIREKILLNYDQEVPYSVEIGIEEFKESEEIIRIKSVVYVARESQKGIIIGHQGKALKLVGTQARKDLEIFFQKKIYLEIFVKVMKDWREKDSALKSFGYKF